MLALAAMVGGCTPAQKNTDADWPSNGRTGLEQRYSPLDRIDANNVGKLGLAWSYTFDTDRGQEATPLVVSGVLYTSTAWSKVFAFDAANGKMLWNFDPKVPPETLASACCDAVNRGVAFNDGKVFIGTLDGRLIALDAKTGKPVWSVDTIGPKASSAHYSITGAPRVVGRNIVIGNAGAEFGVRGYATAYDAATGKLAWRFYTVPNASGKADGAASDDVLKAKASETWSDGLWKQSGGGGTAWDSFTYDSARNLLYIGVGNGGPYDWYRRSGGKGDNLFLSSIVAVDADTGKYRWHYQTTPGDSWDYTATQQMVAATLKIDGKQRDVLLQAPKNGFFYVLDRTTGKLISAKPYVPVTWATGINMETGRPVEAPNAHYQKAPSIQQPSGLGGHSWHAMAYSPRTRLVYIPAQIVTGGFEKVPDFTMRPLGMNVGIAIKGMPHDPAQVAAIRAAATGRLIAWNPVEQRAEWTVEHPSFINGGTLATGGDLVFQGTGEGNLVAYDARNGRKRWSFTVGTAIIAPPISYAIKDEQYVAVMSGYGGIGALVGGIVPDQPRRPGRLVVFKLGGAAKMPVNVDTAQSPVDVSGYRSSGNVAAGEQEYGRTCSVCHGINASVRYTADLRRSAALGSAEAWRSIVIDGGWKERGMIGFKAILTPQKAEDIRAYVLSEARRLQAGQRPER